MYSTDKVKLQQDLYRLETWQSNWRMKFNPSKCSTISIGTRAPTKTTYNFCGENLPSVDSQTYLGVNITNNLSWKKHVSETCKKSQRVLGILRRNLWSCSPKVKELAYTTLVRPLLEYSSTAWDPHLKSDIHCLERVQRQAARFILNDCSTTPGTVTNLLKELDWLSLETQRKINRLTMMYKIINKLVDVQVDDILTSNTRISRGHTKKQLQIHTRTKVFDNSFFPRTVKDWNNIPQLIADATSVPVFKEAAMQIFK